MKTPNFLLFIGLLINNSINCAETSIDSKQHSVDTKSDTATPVEIKPTEQRIVNSRYCVNLMDINKVALLPEAQQQKYIPFKDYVTTFNTIQKSFVETTSKISTKSLGFTFALEKILEEIIKKQSIKEAYDFIYYFNILCTLIKATNFSLQQEYYSSTKFQISETLQQNTTTSTNQKKLSTYLEAVSRLVDNFQIKKSSNIFKFFFQAPDLYYNANQGLKNVKTYTQSVLNETNKQYLNRLALALYQANLTFIYEVVLNLMEKHPDNLLKTYFAYLFKFIDIYQNKQFADDGSPTDVMIGKRMQMCTTQFEKLQKEIDAGFKEIQKIPRNKGKYINISSCFITLPGNITLKLSDEFKKLYFQVYDLAKNSPERLAWSSYNAFTNQNFTFRITPQIPGFIEKPHQENPIAETNDGSPEKALNNDLDDIDNIMKAFEPEENQVKKTKKSKKNKASKKTNSTISVETTKTEKENTNEPEETNTTKDIDELEEEEKKEETAVSSFYNYNDELANKRIFLQDRIKEWYMGKGQNCIAIKNQGYLTPDTLRNNTLKSVMHRDKLTQEEAIRKIIMQHQLPISLIKNILIYGTIIPNEDSSITVAAPVQYKNGDTPTVYYLAEIAGKIEGDSINIWHAFLRDVNIKKHLLNLVSNVGSKETEDTNRSKVESLMKKLSLEERIEKKVDEIADKIEETVEGFIFAQEKDDWKVIDETVSVKIKKGNVTFTIFKE